MISIFFYILYKNVFTTSFPDIIMIYNLRMFILNTAKNCEKSVTTIFAYFCYVKNNRYL